jgi:hypothetical protein
MKSGDGDWEHGGAEGAGAGSSGEGRRWRSKMNTTTPEVGERGRLKVD